MSDITRLGRYQIKRVLGRGAMGVVYEGHDPTLNRRVAIKTILRNAAIDEETARAYSTQFSREAQAAGRLNHPNIVQVHDFAEEGDVAYLVMEYIQGRELRAFFDAKEKFEPAEAVRIMGELLDALDFAHEAGVIHRDVKPANVMVDAQRRVKLADFGVARIQESERSAAGTMVGTPAFMSPEQIQGAKIDRRTDIFSAGVVLYQLLTGEQPFTGQGAWTVAKKIMQDDPPRPSAVVNSVSPVFDDVVNKALAKNPAQRFATAREFAAALRGTLAPAQQTVPPAMPAIPAAMPAAKPKSQASEAEVEFWRSIQNSSDADEFEFYLEQFPEGTYAPLARHKIAKLREPLEAEQKEAEERARQEAAEKARAEAEAKEAARKQAEENARRAAEEKARQEAQERARREAEAKARREAEERARREATEKALREAQEKARREAEEKARQAQALAKLQQQEAAARAKVAVDPEATVAIGRAAPAAPKAPPPPPAAPGPQKKSMAVPAAIAAVVIIVGAIGYFTLGRKPAPAPAPAPAPVAEAPKPAAPAVDIEKIRRETEERVRKEYADKSAAEQAAAAKAAADKAVQEKLLAAKAEKAAADKAAAEKAQAEKAAASKQVAEKAAAEKAAAEKAAAEKAAADKAAAEKAAADKAAAEKAAAEKAAAEKAAAEKAAAAKAAAARKPGWPAVGDKYAFESRDLQTGNRTQITVEITGVAPTGITEHYRVENGPDFTHTYKPGAFLRGGGPGIGLFSPFLNVLQEIRPGMTWSNIPFERFGNCSNNASLTCVLSAKVIGRERITTKAGSYNAWRVELQSESSNIGGGTGSVEITYWYADEVGRLVKYEGRVRRGRGPPPTDMELVSFTPASPR